MDRRLEVEVEITCRNSVESVKQSLHALLQTVSTSEQMVPFFTANQAYPEYGFTVLSNVRVEAWGEIWRARRSDGKAIILVAYTTPEGDEIFEESLPALRQWTKVTTETHVCGNLLDILEISEGAIPFILVEDPQGKTLRETVLEAEEQLSLEAQGKIALHMAKAMAQGEAYSVAPVGLTPDTVFHAPANHDAPWRVLPVGPGSRTATQQLCGGRYFPKDAAKVAVLHALHADSYSLAWLWVEVFRRDFESPWCEPKEAIPYRSLSYVLENGLVPKAGVYVDADTVMRGVDRWLTKQMQQDIAELEEKELRKKRGKFVNSLIDNKKKILVYTIVLICMAGIGTGVWYFVSTREQRAKVAEASVPRSKQVPGDVVYLFLEAWKSGNTTAAAELGVEDLADQISDSLERIEKIKQAKSISALGAVTPIIAGGSYVKIVETAVKDPSGKVIALLVFSMQQRANFDWYIAGLHLKPLYG